MRILGAVLVLGLLPACYFGRSPGAKRNGYAANGTAIVIGSLLVVTAVADSNSCSDSAFVNDCSGAGAANALVATLGAIIAGVGLVGVGVNAAIPTEPDPPRPVTGQVKVPGLKPATHLQGHQGLATPNPHWIGGASP